MKILIVSGAGVLAGTSIYNRLIKKIVDSGKIKCDQDFPELVLYNYPFKSINESGFFDADLAHEELKNIFVKFPDFDQVVIACNSFHLLNFGRDEVLSLPQLAIQEFNLISTPKKALVLCSENARVNNLFNGEHVEYSDEALSKKMDEIIKNNICSYKKYTKRNFKLLNNIIAEKKYTHLMVGCTEFSLMDWKKLVNIPIIDSVEVVIDKLVERV